MEIFDGLGLDVGTLAFVLLILTFLMGVLMAFLRTSASHVPGPRYWFWGSILMSLGLTIFWFYPRVSDYLAFVVAATLISGGMSLYLAGIWSFQEKRFNRWILVWLPAVELLQGSFFMLVYPHDGLRMMMYSLLHVVYALFVLREALSPPSAKLRATFIVLGIAALIHIVIMSTRAYLSIADGFSPTGPAPINMVMIAAGSLGQVAYMFCFLLMVTLRLAEEYEVQIRDRDRFFNIIAHDLKSPVGAILSFLQLVNEDKDLSHEEQKLYLSELEKLSRSTLHLIQNLLDWSRKQTGNYQPDKEHIALRGLLSENVEFLRTLARAKKIEISLPAQDDLLVHVDKRMLETVIRNVVSNSIKFTPEKGRILIDYKPNSKYFDLIVRDNGVGMTDEKLKTIFSLGTNKATKGTWGESGSGLGLILCKEFLERNGGSIRIMSRLNEGTETTIRLPMN